MFSGFLTLLLAYPYRAFLFCAPFAHLPPLHVVVDEGHSFSAAFVSVQGFSVPSGVYWTLRKHILEGRKG